jgi:hypothetical protein
MDAVDDVALLADVTRTVATSCSDRQPVALIAIFAYSFPCQNSFSRNVRWREPIRERRWSGHGL